MKTTTSSVGDYLSNPPEKPGFSKLLKQVAKGLGVVPEFIRLNAESLEMMAWQWENTRFSYLDNPLSSLFKERSFVYLSSFCKTKYCLVRYVDFLAGPGYPSGDKSCPAHSVEKVIRLLQFFLLERLGQVLTNLISNAIKYSPNGGDITIGCLKNKKGITVSIQDKGIGIPKKMQVKVFDRFSRVQQTLLQDFPGMGLGLCITADIMHQHGGTIKVESNASKGSTFFFTIPRINNRYKKNVA